MKEIQAHTGNMKIESYNLAEFLTEIQEGILQGFRLDLHTNENYPYGSGSYYSTILVPESQLSEQEKIEVSQPEDVDTGVEEVVETLPTPTRGRKPSKK